jgi:mitotic spindle assembly checkpoint protein MAD1
LSSGAETASSSTLRQKHSSLASELAELKEHAAAVQAANDLLERRVATGEYDPTTFRCLQLDLNPSTMDLAVRTETLKALRAENAALIEQLRREGGSEPAGGAGGGVVPRETYDRVLKEREEEKAQMEKRLMRLKEVRRSSLLASPDAVHDDDHSRR